MMLAEVPRWWAFGPLSGRPAKHVLSLLLRGAFPPSRPPRRNELRDRGDQERVPPGLPIGTIMPSISMFAVANSALINKLMASRLVYGMARQRVVPPILGRVGEVRRTPWMAILFTTLLALGLVFLVSFASADAVRTLGGTTALVTARRVHSGQSGGGGGAAS